MATSMERVDELVEESSYVFKATVTQLNASNEPAVRAGPGLIVARVDEAFRARETVGVENLRGREVTIQLANGSLAVGENVIVLATEWVYGAQIAVRAVAHYKATSQTEKAVVEAVERLPTRLLEARLDRAALVVDGEVESIKASPVPDGQMLRSPSYKLAVVRVVSALKGKPGEHVNVLFPTSPAPPWRFAPRLKEHESAVLILHHETALKAPAGFYTVLEAGDVHPRDALGSIKSLLKR